MSQIYRAQFTTNFGSVTVQTGTHRANGIASGNLLWPLNKKIKLLEVGLNSARVNVSLPAGLAGTWPAIEWFANGNLLCQGQPVAYPFSSVVAQPNVYIDNWNVLQVFGNGVEVDQIYINNLYCTFDVAITNVGALIGYWYMLYKEVEPMA